MVFWRNILIVLAVAGLAACSRAPTAIVGVDGSSVSAFDISGNTLVDVMIATTRAPDANPAVMFGRERSDEVNFAKVTVSIPPNHAVGEITRPQRIPPDPRTEFAILAPEMIPSDSAFVATVNAELAERAPSDRDLLVFVHGYNTDLAAAVMRTAQFSNDVGFKGIPIVFTWASAGQTVDYLYDLNSALHARDGLLHTGSVLARSNADGFHIFAHSMGNMLTVEAMRQAAIGPPTRDGRLNIRAIALASPDIDIDLFRKQLSHIPVGEVPIFVFVSSDDKALAFSRRIAGGVDRVGAADPSALEDLGVVVVDLSAVENKEAISHTKFANSPEVIQIIGTGIREGNQYETRDSDGVLRVRDIAALPVKILGGGSVVVVD